MKSIMTISLDPRRAAGLRLDPAFLGIAVFVALFSGCSTPHSSLVLAPVGPPSPHAPGAGTGTLMVFSAFDNHAHFNNLLYRRWYTDYKVLSKDGELLMSVQNNDNGTSLESPKAVKLPTGEYRILARANGYGMVTVPIVIAADQVTTVHLEGGGTHRQDGRTPSKSEAVCLPGGEVIGWQAARAE